MNINQLILEMYDPPYNPEQIRKNYGDELAKKLLNDPIHKLRAENGIELIHKEPTKKELKRIYKNWYYMTPEQKSKSDEYSLKIFGKTNKDHYKELIKTYK